MGAAAVADAERDAAAAARPILTGAAPGAAVSGLVGAGAGAGSSGAKFGTPPSGKSGIGTCTNSAP